MLKKTERKREKKLRFVLLYVSGLLVSLPQINGTCVLQIKHFL
jgi:hypothetical protein